MKFINKAMTPKSAWHSDNRDEMCIFMIYLKPIDFILCSSDFGYTSCGILYTIIQIPDCNTIGINFC